MIVNVVCALIETLVQMYICLGIYIMAYRKEEKVNFLTKVIVLMLFAFAFLFKTLNNIQYAFSVSAIFTDIPVITMALLVTIKLEFLQIVIWSFFSTITVVIIKLPILVITGLICNEPLADMNLVKNNQPWSRVISCLIFLIIFLICIKENNLIVKYLKNATHQRAMMLLIGGIEYIITLYIMYLGWHGFTVQTFIITICLMLMLFMLIVCLVVMLEYQIVVRWNHLLKAKENSMKMNYVLINNEIERNRKINHDNKHDLEYLYYCFEQKCYEQGMKYIEQKESRYIMVQKNMIWTGYGSIDFLINRAKARADEKKILFTIKVDIVEIPIEEYDFFSVLSNLLDNAVDASMQNNEGEGYILLKILSLNNVFKLKIENTYLVEPNKNGKRFISNKEDKELHGWGIENVKEIVNKYNGSIEIRYGNGIFLVDLIFI